MKLSKWIGVLIVVAMVCTTVLSGCKSKTDVDKSYNLYTYDTDSNQFVQVGCRLRINEEKTAFSMSFLDAVHLYGDVTEQGAGYNLHIDGNVYMQSQAALEDLSEQQEEALSEESLQVWADAITLNEQVYFYGDNAFSDKSVELIRRVDGSAKSTYTSIEGYYESTANAENIYLFRNGKVYSNSDVKDDDGKATFDADGNPVMNKAPGAEYLMKQGFIVLTRLDATGAVLMDGNNKPRKIVYLFAGIEYPTNLAELVQGDDEEANAKRALAAKIAGKTVGLLTKSIYSRNNLQAYNFD